MRRFAKKPGSEPVAAPRIPEHDDPAPRREPGGQGRRGWRRVLEAPAGPAVELSEDDWRRFEELLAAGCWRDPAPEERAPVGIGDVRSAMASLRASAVGEVMLPAGPLSDQMLDLWSLIRGLNPEAAQPVEAFLSALTTRQIVSAVELAAVCAEIEESLAPWSAPAAGQRRDQAACES